MKKVIILALSMLLSGDKAANNASEFTTLELPVSQYDVGGSSSCTSIACSVTVSMLKKLSINESIQDSNWLVDNIFLGNQKHQILLSKLNGSVEHLSIEEYFAGNKEDGIIRYTQIPTQKLITGVIFSEMISEAVNELTSRGISHIGIIFTKPPETVAMVISMQADHSIDYFFFDSHSRPQFNIHGAYLYHSGDMQQMVAYLNTLFTVANISNGSNDNLNIEEMMYSAVEYVFIGLSKSNNVV